MSSNLASEPLRIGFIGSGFIAHFHLQGLEGVRNARIAGVYSPNAAHRSAFAGSVNGLELGPCQPFESVEQMVESGEVDAVWILGPNDLRLDHMRTIHSAVKSGRASLAGIACEKPLARNLADAREMLRLAEDAGLSHGYFENQVFTRSVERGKEIIWRRAVPSAGRPYLVRASEEHNGPHSPWFWQGERQGGGALLDMMCHSVEAARYLLTDPNGDPTALKLVSADATIMSLKWNNPRYAEQLRQTSGGQVDYSAKPSEDFAQGILVLEDPEGQRLVIEASTSWAYVGPGLRVRLEMLGPEYSMEFSSLDSGLKLFFSREISGSEGEDMLEKQNAEQGLMPVVPDEASTYGYVAENRHMVKCFRKGNKPVETFHDGVKVMEMLMALYRSAEIGQTVHLPDSTLEEYIPPVARGEFRG